MTGTFVLVHVVDVLDRSLRDRLLAYVAVAGGTLDLLANVRGMVEPDVILVREAVHTLPGQVQSLVPHRRDLLDPRSIRRDRLVADHAGPHSGNARLRSLVHALVAHLTGDPFADVNVMGKLERLLVDRPPIQEVVQSGAKGGTRRRKDTRHLTRQPGEVRSLAGNRGRLHVLAADARGERRKADRDNPDEADMFAQRALPDQRVPPLGPRLRR